MALGLTAPAFAEPPLDKTVIRYLGSAGQVTFIELAEDLGYLTPLKLKWVGNTISGPQDIQTVVTGDIDIGGAFYGAILKLIAAKAPIKAVVGYYGSDANTYYGYFVKDDSPIKTARDLIGKKVAVNTLGAHLEFVLREYLARSGLSAGEARQVTLVAIPPVSGEQALRQGQVEVSALSGVLRDKALERGGIRSLFNDTDLFGQFTGGAYVLREKFINDNSNASRKLVDGLSRAIEWAQITLARNLGLPVADTQVMHFGKEIAIVIERYDRQFSGNEIVRICQALGILPTRKYQNDGGPSPADVIELLRTYSTDRVADVDTFVEALAFNWLIGATDAHAKNYSLLLAGGPHVRLAPSTTSPAFFPTMTSICRRSSSR
ncbi:HipA domain-containing protein [Bradyrhizobium sp. S3.12.5]|uniref:HipA domain-containing protein n=1 Tax=Bradyrhizobium sp. S3.12.5 TaxID=3156386 RepID=UPI003394AB25